MAPPPGAACWTLVLVERERRVAGEVLFRNGHMARLWRKRASMVASGLEVISIVIKEDLGILSE